MEDDTASEGVEVIVLEDEDFRDMFQGPEEEQIEHCMSRVSLQDHDYHQPREIMKVKLDWESIRSSPRDGSSTSID